MRTAWAWALALALVACGGDDGTGSGDRVDTILAIDGDAASGEGLYADNCALCHGDDGSGGSGSSLLGKSDEAEIVETILFGEDGTAMAPFEDQLDDQEIADITAFVLTL